jgi:MraZ protein
LSYFGKSTVAIDAKGRTNLPRELRGQLPESAPGRVVLAPGPAGELHVYDAPSFDAVLRNLRKGERTPERQRLIDILTANTSTCVLDEQNRITIPSDLLKYAKLGNRVTFFGVGDRIKLMAPESAELRTSLPDASDALAQDFFASLEVYAEGDA